MHNTPKHGFGAILPGSLGVDFNFRFIFNYVYWLGLGMCHGYRCLHRAERGVGASGTGPTGVQELPPWVPGSDSGPL